MTPEDYANVISLGVSILFFGIAASMFLDELKDYLIDRLHRKQEKISKQ